MTCWLFISIIYALAQYTDEHLVVLQQVSKAAKSPETKPIDPSSLTSASAEGTPEKSEENSPQGLAADSQLSNENGKQSSESDSDEKNIDIEQNVLPEGNSDSTQSDSENQSDGLDKKSNDGTVYLLEVPEHKDDNPADKARKIRNWNRWVAEVSRGNNAEIMGTNPDTYQPDAYFDLGRRFEEKNINQTTEYAPPGKEIVPIQAPKEVVALIASQSAKTVASQSKKYKGSNVQQDKKLLRTGEFWDGFWTEDGTKVGLRTSNPVLGVVKAKIKPGNEFYDLVAKMKQISPRLLYIMNEKKDD